MASEIGDEYDVDPIVQARSDARAALFRALEVFGRARGEGGRGELLRCLDRWTCLGRGGE
jgi:hypothetical protein